MSMSQDNVIVRTASGALTAGEVSAPLRIGSWVKLAIVQLLVTTLTLADADDEVDFWLQTTYDDGTTWVDLENVHFSNADNGTTASKILTIGWPRASNPAQNITDGTLADNTKLDLPPGGQLRIKTGVTGATAPTYAYSAKATLIGE